MKPSTRQGGVDAPVRCFYADDPVSRPHCMLTAVVRYDLVALCQACQSRRSSVGKATPAVTLPPGPAVEVLDWIGASDEHAAAAQRTLSAAVTRARQAGHSWATIGNRLGISRQAAQQRFTPPTKAGTSRASVHESTTTSTRAS